MILAQSTLFSAYSEADFFGKGIFLALFGLSIICWVVGVYKMLQAKKVEKLATRVVQELKGKENRLLKLQMPGEHPFASVFTKLKTKTLEVLDKNHYFAEEGAPVFLSRNDLELVEAHALTSISAETKKLEKNLFILSTIVTLAPFLGLLGTVWGILLTFGQLQSGMSAASNSAILGGLSTALATTVLGLIIAIPALIFHNYLKNFLKNFSSDMEDFVYETLATVELQYRKP